MAAEEQPLSNVPTDAEATSKTEPTGKMNLRMLYSRMEDMQRSFVGRVTDLHQRNLDLEDQVEALKQELQDLRTQLNPSREQVEHTAGGEPQEVQDNGT